MKKSESIAFFVARPLAFLLKIASPFVKLLTISTNFFVKLFGIDPHALDDHVTEEEIRMMIDVGEEEGTIHQLEKVMINNIFEFNDKTVEDLIPLITEDTMEEFNLQDYIRKPFFVPMQKKTDETFVRIPLPLGM